LRYSGETVDIGDKPTPVLTLAGKPVNMDFGLVDPSHGATGAVATVFAAVERTSSAATTFLEERQG